MPNAFDTKMIVKIKGYYFLLTSSMDDKELDGSKPIGEAMLNIKAKHINIKNFWKYIPEIGYYLFHRNALEG
jgi:hypothetical protein